MDFKDMELIQNIANREDGKEFMDELISFYCLQSAENCQHVVDAVPNIVNQQIKCMHNM